MANDRYLSLAALKAALKEAVDYAIVVLDRGSWATVVSPHGGFTEAGTSELARRIAGRQYNLFDFQGLRTERSYELHVTSTRFRDARLTHLLRHSRAALSVHSMGSCGEKVIWLGGRNKKLKELVLAQLVAAGVSVNPDSPRYRGESPRNFVNMVCREGVQLEFSEELLQSLFVGPAFPGTRKRAVMSADGVNVVKALRRALAQYRRDGAFDAACVKDSCACG